MDGICGAVLNKIKALGATGRYFIISEDEFLESFPDDAERNAEELRKALDRLAGEGYIDIKYSGGSMYCVSLLKCYTPPENEPTKRKPRAIYAQGIFWAAFAGGAASGILAAIVMLLVLLC